MKQQPEKAAVVELVSETPGHPVCNVHAVHAGGGQGCKSGHLQRHSMELG
jgi:hypothetical protein